MTRTRRLLFITVFALALAGCAPVAGRANGVAQAAALATEVDQSKAFECPVTQPPSPAFEPPAPWPATMPYAGEFWYGTNALWTALFTDGTWSGLPVAGDGSVGQKVVFWNQDYDWRTEQQPALTVTARRLDGGPDAEVVSASPATNGFHDELKAFMLVGLNLPSTGCWEVTGEYEGAQVSFVVKVE